MMASVQTRLLAHSALRSRFCDGTADNSASLGLELPVSSNLVPLCCGVLDSQDQKRRNKR
jgi:hypothetical protein